MKSSSKDFFVVSAHLTINAGISIGLVLGTSDECLGALTRLGNSEPTFWVKVPYCVPSTFLSDTKYIFDRNQVYIKRHLRRI